MFCGPGRLVCIGLVVVWLIPTPQRPGDASDEEKNAVVARINEAQEELPYVKLDKIKAHGNRVVELNVTWTGENPPDRKDRRAWGIEADRIALLIASVIFLKVGRSTSRFGTAACPGSGRGHRR